MMVSDNCDTRPRFVILSWCLGVVVFFDKRTKGQKDTMMVSDNCDTRPRFVLLSWCLFYTFLVNIRNYL